MNDFDKNNQYIYKNINNFEDILGDIKISRNIENLF